MEGLPILHSLQKYKLNCLQAAEVVAFSCWQSSFGRFFFNVGVLCFFVVGGELELELKMVKNYLVNCVRKTRAFFFNRNKNSAWNRSGRR
jgi:hypothetical protein